MKLLNFQILFIIVLFFLNQTMSQSNQAEKHFSKQISHQVEFGYLLYLPDDFNAEEGQSYPLMLFLHGSGERGTDLDLVKKHGPPKVAGEMQLPFIVLSPQCPEITWWEVDDVKLLLDEIIETYPVDKNRIYITGLSMGGFATWEMIMKYPGLFAAAVPVCGGGYPFRAHLISHIPVWAFHGAKDNVVPLEYSQRMVDALKKLDAEVRFTIYPEAGHDSWTETYDNPELYQWLLMHSKKNK
jgi:predicted peptidase